MTDQKIKKIPTSNAAKRLARLVAVQALYQASFEEEPLVDIIKNSLEEADTILNGEEGGEEIISERPDPKLFSDIVRGVSEHKEDLDLLVQGAMDQKPSSTRMEVLLRCVLLAGAYELLHKSEIPHKIIISDYIDVSRAFFGNKEPALVNAVLDKICQKIRQ